MFPLQYDDEDDGEDTRRKKKKSRGRGFLIEEAEVDDEVEDDEEWEEGAEELIEKAGRSGRGAALLDDELGGRDGDRHSHRRLQTMLDREPDEIEDYYRRKYADKSEAYGFRGDQGDLEFDDDIAQQTFQPSVK